MKNKTVGFIGGGRITQIVLGGFKRVEKMPRQVVVSDINVDVLNKLKEQFPKVDIFLNNKESASQDIVFLALHPPVVRSVLSEVKYYLKPNSIIVSFAPKISIENLSDSLGGFNRIIRMIPNACSIVNSGYNPITFSQSLTEIEREELIKLFSVLGECPILAEEKLEAYAILTAMGPTYLWFQLYELHEIAKSFGLIHQEVKRAILEMVKGTVMTMYESELSPEEVMDLIPFKPLGSEEENIKIIYRSKLETLFKKLKG